MASLDIHSRPPITLGRNRRTIQTIREVMLSTDTGDDTSLPSLMMALHDNNPPDVYALTAMSAIPVADALRGYYGELGLPEPSIVAVHANKTISRAPADTQICAVKKEVERLTPLVGGRTVALIDQYVATGGTLRLARYMLHKAGAKRTRSDSRTRWYDQAARGDVDVENLTSTHADLMHAIGKQAAKINQANQR